MHFASCVPPHVILISACCPICTVGMLVVQCKALLLTRSKGLCNNINDQSEFESVPCIHSNCLCTRFVVSLLVLAEISAAASVVSGSHHARLAPQSRGQPHVRAPTALMVSKAWAGHGEPAAGRLHLLLMSVMWPV